MEVKTQIALAVAMLFLLSGRQFNSWIHTKFMEKKGS